MLQKKFLILYMCLLQAMFSFSQTATVYGVLRDTEGDATPGVLVVVEDDASVHTTSAPDGSYSLKVPAGKPVTLVFSNISYKRISQTLSLTEGQRLELSPRLSLKTIVDGVTVRPKEEWSTEMISIPTNNIRNIPSASGDFNDIIKTQIGVSSNNELSSAYSVRGGNFDENLVYVNDIEIYRPFLVRSGQQEGLSFTNPDMVSSVNFSAGGFEAKYGDKMSSVLDVTYGKPQKFGGSASGSLLGGSLHLQGVSNNRLVAWSVGSRYKSNAYLLKNIDTKGEYRPRFYDVQAFVTFSISEKWSVEFLGNIANNKYLVIPASRETVFGTVNNALSFKVFFDGQEVMQYGTMLGAVSTTYKPNSKTRLKFIASGYNAKEEEKYTVQGQYYIDQLEADFGKDDFGQVAFNRGVGTFLNNGRNTLNATVINLEHKGTRYFHGKNHLLWGARFQHEIIDDKLSEWRMVDSVGYISPYDPNAINLLDVIKAKNHVESNRVMGYLEYIYNRMMRDSTEFTLTSGVRANYWSFNDQTVVSPRVTFAMRPHWKRDIVFKASWGYYYQPPFYREMRDFDGNLNHNIKAQQSIHYLLSADYNLKIWNRPFKIILAGYYKDMKNLIPYEVDNVRIRYFAKNNSVGYATGVDLRINGEFIKGIESWATIGLMQTRENIQGDYWYTYYNSAGDSIVKGLTFNNKAVDSVRHEPGYIPRPTDQLLTFGLFFQDYLPKLPQCKMYLNMIIGTGLPFGPPNHQRWQQTLRMPPYRRVDIGFAYQIIEEKDTLPKKNPFHYLKAMSINLEVLNLLQVNNTVSYTWVTDVTGRSYAIPNYLTRRQLNVKLQIRF